MLLTTPTTARPSKILRIESKHSDDGFERMMDIHLPVYLAGHEGSSISRKFVWDFLDEQLKSSLWNRDHGVLCTTFTLYDFCEYDELQFQTESTLRCQGHIQGQDRFRPQL